MTINAREVLGDCESLLADLTREPPNALWRPKWAGLVALLRAVGHVLDKIDGEGSPEARQVIDRAWEELRGRRPEPKIFWEFIEAERNNVLKAYAFGPRMNTTIRPGAAWLNLATGESGGSPNGPTTFDYFMRSGVFEGQDPRQLCREAIVFWAEYLETIDSEIAQRRSPQTG
ncbi:MAG: hypothetical protein ACREI1_13840 [Nitrospiraceae bacterium]